MKGGGEDGERSSKTTPVQLKKGPWTAEEDAILMEYVNRHGEGNWNSVQKRTGLARCGKSCRLRWANHLRPNLKKGHFTPEEEAAILRLHAQMGNKWARMASQLPGRTDNEIKNYWNTRVKRRQRAGLPLYPAPPPPENIVPRQQRVAVHRSAAGPHVAGMMPFFVANAVGGMAPPRRPRTVPGEYGLMPTLPSLTLTELPSSQFFGETSSGGGSGLLDMLLQQVERNGGEQQEELQLLDQSVMVKLGNSDSSTAETAKGSSTVAINAAAEATDPMNQATHHDDISKLFDMIPTPPTMPALPDWYNDSSGEICKGPQSDVETTNMDGLGPSSGSVAAQIEQEWSIGSFPWNNMPEIC